MEGRIKGFFGGLNPPLSRSICRDNIVEKWKCNKSNYQIIKYLIKQK